MEYGTRVNHVLSLGFWSIVFFFAMPLFVHAADIHFSPASGTYTVGSVFSVSVNVSSTEQTLNAASAVIAFPRDKIEAVSLSTTDSVFNFCIEEPVIDSKAGTIHFECVALNPGFTGDHGRVFGVDFRVKESGKAALHFVSGSTLANDGKGSAIQTTLVDATLTLQDMHAKEFSVTLPTGDASKGRMIRTNLGSAEIDNATYAYGIGRIKDRKKEKKFEQNIQKHLKEQLAIAGKSARWTTKQWKQYTDQFLYGGYTVEEIVRSLLDPRIVHPTTPASLWRTSKEYARSFSHVTWFMLIDTEIDDVVQVKGSDTDRDGLPDVYEKKIIGSNPKKKDTDGDGYDDREEVRSGYSPLVPAAKKKPAPVSKKPAPKATKKK